MHTAHLVRIQRKASTECTLHISSELRERRQQSAQCTSRLNLQRGVDTEYTHTHTHTPTHTHTHTRTHPLTHARTHAHTHTHTRTHARTHARTHTQTHTHREVKCSESDSPLQSTTPTVIASIAPLDTQPPPPAHPNFTRTSYRNCVGLCPNGICCDRLTGRP